MQNTHPCRDTRPNSLTTGTSHPSATSHFSVQFSPLFATPWTAARQVPCPSPTPKFTQTDVHRVGDVIEPCHPLSSPFPPTFKLSQNQGLFQWVSSSHQVARVLEFQLQHQTFQWTLRTDLLQDGLVGSPCCPRDSQESSPKSQFKSIKSSVLSFLNSPALTSIHDHWKNHSLDLDGPFLAK